MIVLPFIEQNPVFLCEVDGKPEDPWQKCDTMSNACKQHPVTIDYNKSVSSITLEYKLYCDDDWKKGFLGTSLFIVATISTLLVGIISNNYGRKPAIIFCYFFGTLGTILIGLVTPDYWVTLACYSLMGFLIPFLNFSSLWLNEIGDKDYRNRVNGMI